MTADRIREATRADLAAIVRLLAEDSLGAGREGDADDPVYAEAFARIAASPDNRVLVVERAGDVIACAQVTSIPGLSRRGRTRLLVESVRVRSDLRGQGIGAALMRHIVASARAEGCGLVQLTSDKTRADAHRFYARLGFRASHVGFKLDLAP